MQQDWGAVNVSPEKLFAVRPGQISCIMSPTTNTNIFFYYDTDTEMAVTLLVVHLFLPCINPALEALSTGKRLRSTPSAVLLLQVRAPELWAVAVLGEELILH